MKLTVAEASHILSNFSEHQKNRSKLIEQAKEYEMQGTAVDMGVARHLHRCSENILALMEDALEVGEMNINALVDKTETIY